ncbi:hypothetical protein ALNOE001_22000 [Candidatus Methanobinarius endosymbioticus]|uniref:Uncharacterized protein n=1 Tax=Candidatus Methanobinarius endosymbioticus TaxID=2006182 RepID=A0A366MAB3_9EURY|nr:hypothetical protein ALNOE001_22000 [Candidatus Methanobinarius endosymbioticus]
MDNYYFKSNQIQEIENLELKNKLDEVGGSIGVKIDYKGNKRVVDKFFKEKEEIKKK